MKYFAMSVFVLAIAVCTANAAEIEMLSGQKFSGTIIRRTEAKLQIEVDFDGASMAMTLDLAKIHKITDNGKTEIINAKAAPAPRPQPQHRRPVEKPKPKPVTYDWPNWRGPNNNGISLEKDWKKSWQSPPKVLWEKQIGEGYSCISTSQGRAYTLGNADNQDTVWCFDAETGKELWKHSYACGTGQYPGPRATPAIDNGMVYTLSRKGDLYAFNAVTGAVIWNINAARESGAKAPGWDHSSSPIIYKDKLLLNMGTHGLALNKKTGETIWDSGSAKGGYASIVPVVHKGKDTLLVFGADHLYAVEPNSGKSLWKFPWKTKYDVNSADPILHGTSIFISTGYNKGCALVDVSGSTPKQKYANTKMRNHFNSSVLYNGFLYGFNENVLTCMEFKSGTTRWSERGLGEGALILADGILIIISEDGRLVTAKADPASFKKLGEVSVLSKRCWSSPTLSNGRIYVRNQAGKLVCVDVR